MSEIKFSPESLKDLQEIKKYITDELCEPSAADRVVSEILSKIRMLETFSGIGSPLSAITHIPTDYRYLVCGHYMVFYRPACETVFIVRVLYGKRNYMEILFGKE